MQKCGIFIVCHWPGFVVFPSKSKFKTEELKWTEERKQSKFENRKEKVVKVQNYSNFSELGLQEEILCQIRLCKSGFFFLRFSSVLNKIAKSFLSSNFFLLHKKNGFFANSPYVYNKYIL